MRKINLICTVFAAIAVSVFIVSFAQNITVRTEEAYSYYFNETRLSNKLHTSYSSNDVAKLIADYLNSFSDESFQIWEDNGYDLEAVFSEDESHNMGLLKYALRRSALTCVASFFIACGIYAYFIFSERKLLMRKSYLASIPLSVAGIIFASVTSLGKEWQLRMAENLHFIKLEENSLMSIVLGPELMEMLGKLYILVSITLLLGCSFIAIKLSKDDKVFSGRR